MPAWRRPRPLLLALALSALAWASAPAAGTRAAESETALDVEVRECALAPDGAPAAPEPEGCEQREVEVAAEDPPRERREPRARRAGREAGAPRAGDEVHDVDLRRGRNAVRRTDGRREQERRARGVRVDGSADPAPGARHRDHGRSDGHDHGDHQHADRDELVAPREEAPTVATSGGSGFADLAAGAAVTADEALAQFAIPPFLVPIYVAAGRAYGVPWNVLASINQIETDFGRIRTQVSSAGALGWMQFMPGTWRRYGVDASGDGVADPYNPVDAIYAAARYLRASGAPRDLRRAVFAYNRADWYVDRVLRTAGIYGALPAGLVAETGSLAFGRFPMRGPVTYGDDVRRAQADGRQPRGILLRAPAGARAVATQGVVVRRILLEPRLARVLGRRGALPRNGLAAPLRERAAQPETVVRLALAGLELALRGALRKPGRALRERVERLAEAAAARPAGERSARSRPQASALPAGYGRMRERGVAVVVEDAMGNRYRYGGLARVAPGVRPGARLAGGQTIGTAGRAQEGVRFSVRAAGGEPVDPRPLLDGYRLQEAADFQHAVRPLGASPFVSSTGEVAHSVLGGSQRELARRVLADPGIDIYPGGRQDIARGIIDRRVLGALLYLRRNGLELTVTSLRSGHSYYTAGGGVSAHSFGAAVDIAAFNGQVVTPATQGPGSLTEQAIRLLMRLEGAARPDQLISLMNLGGPSFAMADHGDHLHIGYSFQPSLGVGRTGEVLGSVRFGGATGAGPAPGPARRGDARRLARRLRAIRNPSVRRLTGRGALRVEAERPTDAERRAARRLAARRAGGLAAVPTAAGARILDVDVPRGARGDEAWALGLVDGGGRPGWARRQVVVLRHERGRWSIAAAPRDRRGRVASPPLRRLAVTRGGRGYAVGDRGHVARLAGARPARLLARATRRDLADVAVLGDSGRSAVAVGTSGTVVALAPGGARRERSAPGGADLRAVTLDRARRPVAAGTLRGAAVVVRRGRGDGWSRVRTGLELGDDVTVRPLALAATGDELWLAGGIGEDAGLPTAAERAFAARLRAGRWTTFCGRRPSLAGVRELAPGAGGRRPCDAPLGPEGLAGGRAGAIAAGRRGVVVATARTLLVRDDGAFVAPHAPLGTLAGWPAGRSPRALALAPSGDGWALGPDGTLTRLHAPAARRDRRAEAMATTTTASSERGRAATALPWRGPSRVARVAVAAGGRALALGAGAAARWRQGRWQRLAGPREVLRDAAFAGREEAWAITEAGALVHVGPNALTRAGESVAGRAARDRLLEALGHGPLGAGGLAPPASRSAIAFASPQEGYVVGIAGGIERFDGERWRLEPVPPGPALLDVAATPQLALAGGDRGRVLERVGGAWRPAAAASAAAAGRPVTHVDVLPDGTGIALAGGVALARSAADGTWAPAPLAPLGEPALRFGAFRAPDGALRAWALVGAPQLPTLIAGDDRGWRPLVPPGGVQPVDAAWERGAGTLLVSGRVDGRAATTRLGADELSAPPGGRYERGPAGVGADPGEEGGPPARPGEGSR